ncbi:NmrA family NAD(P)-binding protein [Actinomycetospora callitridis]|uniref:NmrA family NAD(P)-binding protein n=1 Tax=Actinomycetospora callitridis TaxID=913944 RepID=UPI002365A242|nr:NmrA family NAD(P)-binding protein [Actinomycetospora callitridis]MDD7917311.1 NmrA family NAD(P)-binding protein [Actinomycetospora callitridis]
MHPTVLVTGATGATGAALLTALEGRDVTPRVMVRDPGQAARFTGDVAVADLDDGAAVARALEGVDAAYLVTPSSEQAAERQNRFADAAVTAGVRRLVVLSQFAARPDSPVRFLRWHAEVEAHLATLPIERVVLRPNLFFQGLLAFAEQIARTGRFAAPIGDAAISAVDVRDIGAVAAATLVEPGHAGATYTLTGPRAVTHPEIAAALSAATGRPVAFDDVTPAAFAEALAWFLPPWGLAGLVEDYAHYARGEAAVVDPAIAQITGRPAIDVTAFARDHAGAFTGAGAA